MREEYLKIFDTYGINNQQRKLAEETFELQEAILEYQNFIDYSPTDASSIEVNGDIFTMPKYGKYLIEHILEEIADVMVLLEQFIEYYNIDRFDIAKIMEQKVKRTLERMENDNNKN